MVHIHLPNLYAVHVGISSRGRNVGAPGRIYFVPNNLRVLYANTLSLSRTAWTVPSIPAFFTYVKSLFQRMFQKAGGYRRLRCRNGTAGWPRMKYPLRIRRMCGKVDLSAHSKMLRHPENRDKPTRTGHTRSCPSTEADSSASRQSRSTAFPAPGYPKGRIRPH